VWVCGCVFPLVARRGAITDTLLLIGFSYLLPNERSPETNVFTVARITTVTNVSANLRTCRRRLAASSSSLAEPLLSGVSVVSEAANRTRRLSGVLVSGWVGGGCPDLMASAKGWILCRILRNNTVAKSPPSDACSCRHVMYGTSAPRPSATHNYGHTYRKNITRAGVDFWVDPLHIKTHVLSKCPPQRCYSPQVILGFRSLRFVHMSDEQNTS